MNLRDEILAMDDIETKTIPIKQWKNKKILIKSITAGKRFEIILESTNEETGVVDNGKINMLLLIATVYDPKTKELLFKAEDYHKLLKKSSAPIHKILELTQELNGIGEEEGKKAEKN